LFVYFQFCYCLCLFGLFITLLFSLLFLDLDYGVFFLYFWTRVFYLHRLLDVIVVVVVAAASGGVAVSRRVG
jgi:hypothetical protein